MADRGVVLALWGRQPGRYFVLSTKSATGEWQDEYFRRDELDDVSGYIADQKGCDLYGCPHGLSKPSRKKEFAVPPLCLSADLDEVDPRDLDIEPTIAIESSPGRYVGLWLTDEPITEELNRRMTYATGADKGGWHFGKVLRLCGGRNYKYPEQPRIRTLWVDGPTYRVSDLQRRLPQASRSRLGATEGHSAIDPTRHDAREVVKRIHPGVWSSLQPVAAGNRSGMIFKIVSSLHERGANPDEIAAVLWQSAAFRSKHGDDIGMLEQEIDRILDKIKHHD